MTIKYYDNPSCTGMVEFEKDLKKINNFQKMLSKRRKGRHFNIRLALNHIIILYNMFGELAPHILFYKIKEEYWDVLKTFLIFIDRLPNAIKINDTFIHTSNIPIDFDLLNELEGI